MTLEFDKATHHYTLDGRTVPHVTGALRVLQDYAGVPRDVLERKAEIGDAVHYATELVDADDLDDATLPEVLRGYVAGYRAFLRDTGFTPEFSECRVYSSTYGYAGTFDRIGKFAHLRGCKPAWRALIDLKATYTILPAVGPQTAAYERAWNEQNRDMPIQRRFAVQLKADGTYNLHACTDASDWSVFLSALTLWNWKQRHNIEVST